MQVKLVHSLNPLKYFIKLNKIFLTMTYLKEDA